MLIAEVRVGRVRGRQRLGWMDGVKVALSNIGMTVEAACQCARDRKTGEPWYMCNSFAIDEHCTRNKEAPE